ncbi:MAG: pirin-like C-terminal cupin domain-containing protein [Saprospiraceae bacterium]
MRKNVMDIGAHPHRGFETVTFIFDGELHHKDSRGYDQRISKGGVQWMTAAKGIVHSEGASKEFIRQGGQLEIIQLWIHLPSSMKMNQSKYQGFQKDEIPVVERNGIKLNVISGSFENIEGPVDSLTDISAFTLKHDNKGEISIPFAKEHNVVIYQLDGLSKINGVNTGTSRMLVFEKDGDQIHIEAKEKGKMLILAGIPINEKVVSHGPFVMNTQTEILQAIRDYQMGKMGILIE